MDSSSSNDLSGTVRGPVVQAGHVDQVYFAAQAPTALAGLPPGVPEFTGRDAALDAVAASLRPAPGSLPPVVPSPPVVSTRPVVSTLAGTAGVGKTALALRAAHEALAAGWFPGGVLFADLQGYGRGRRLTPDAAVSVFLGALGVADELFPSTAEGRLSLYRSRLAEIAARGQAVLLVLDNASSAGQVSPLLPGSPQHRVLVTSRHTLGDLPGSRIVDVGVLEPAEAAALIARTLRVRRADDTRAQDEPGAVGDLVALCGRLPLALAVVSSILAGDPDQSVGELAAALRDRATRLAELSYGDRRSVTAAFELSYARLAPEEARAFRLLSLSLGQQVSVDAAAALLGRPVAGTRRLLRALRDGHMVEPGRPRGRVRFHDLIRLFAEQRRREEDDEEAVAAAVDGMLVYFRDAARDARQAIVRAALAGRRDEDVEAWLDTERLSLRAALHLARDRSRPEVLLPLAGDVSWFLRRQQDWAAGLEACGMAVESALDSGDGGQQAQAFYDKGDFLKHMAMEVAALDGGPRDHREALAAYEQALARYRSLGDRAGEARTLHSMGTAARRDGDYARAREHYGAALRLYRALADHPAVGHTLFNLGSTDRSLGERASAGERYREALETYRRIGNSAGRARTLHHLGHLALDEGRPDAARAYWQQARAGYQDAGLPPYAAEVADLIARLPGPRDG